MQTSELRWFLGLLLNPPSLCPNLCSYGLLLVFVFASTCVSKLYIVSLSLCVSLRSLLDEVELLYGAVFCHGSLEVARTSLHTKASLRLQVRSCINIHIQDEIGKLRLQVDKKEGQSDWTHNTSPHTSLQQDAFLYEPDT